MVQQPDNANAGWLNSWWFLEARVGSFTLDDESGGEDFVCHRGGSEFGCDDLVSIYDQDACDEGCTDAVITATNSLAGSFDGDERFSATFSTSSTCEGADCAYTTAQPIATTFTAEWVASDWESFEDL